jgi:hypothetical protein
MQNELSKLNEKREEILLGLGIDHTEEELQAVESAMYEVWEQSALLEDQENEYLQEQRRMELDSEIRAELEREMRGY